MIDCPPRTGIVEDQPVGIDVIAVELVVGEPAEGRGHDIDNRNAVTTAANSRTEFDRRRRIGYDLGAASSTIRGCKATASAAARLVPRPISDTAKRFSETQRKRPRLVVGCTQFSRCEACLAAMVGLTPLLDRHDWESSVLRIAQK